VWLGNMMRSSLEDNEIPYGESHMKKEIMRNPGRTPKKWKQVNNILQLHPLNPYYQKNKKYQ
jgi:hypothetical protein